MKKRILFFVLLFFGFFMYATTAENSFDKMYKATREFFLELKQQIKSDVVEETLKKQDTPRSQAVLLPAPCAAFTLPFKEGFNQSSTSYSCWTIVDANQDATSPTGNNIWKQSTLAPQEGDRVMQFNGSGAATKHDDWLISPQVKFTGGIYAITFYYKTSASYSNEFEVLLSTTGTDLDKFTEVLLPKATYNTANYIKKTVYIQGITADVNIAWRVVASGTAIVYIDNVTIEKVDCIAPQDEMILSNLEKNKVTVTLKDDINTAWEYFVQPAGGVAPVGSGTVSNTKAISVTRINGAGTNLQPNTEYEIYIKSSCGQGKTSMWVGPLVFRTLCDDMVLPFWEGFNKNSPNINCWTFFDGNKDATSPTSSNIWKLQASALTFEGDQHAYFYGFGATTKHDDWLISPNFNFVANKVYRLKYHYKATAGNENEFEVLASNSGIDPVNFTKSVVAKRTYKNDTYIEEVAFITGFVGKVNIAWHVVSTGSSTLYIDNVFVEEVIDCPEPIKLEVKNIEIDQATVGWTDDFQATDWEYVVQELGKGAPVANGLATKSKNNNVTKDFDGKNLEANTEYEFYVRTVCGNGKFSIWSGPFKFKTNCSTFTTPFWEGFNVNSKTFGCWTVLNNNGDLYTWKTSTINYEGGMSMYFYGYGTGTFVHDDWLISPVIKFEAGKIYRLKYHYRASDYDNDFEVVLSSSGTDVNNFTKVVVAKDKYKNANFVEEIAFISGVSGDVNIAFHSVAKGITYLYIDNVFIEEVSGCPEPLNLTAKDIEKDKATLSWTETDVFKGTGWEYVVQEAGTGVPTTAGVSTTSKDNTVTKEQSGKNLMPNTEYEYYVRTVCGNGSFSIWSGPYKFYTTCDVYQAPFWEGFNTDSKTLRCWTIIDANKDAGSSTGDNIWNPSTDGAYEGDQAMRFFGTSSRSDDWLISPMIDLDGGKYVLKYHYMTDSIPVFNNEFEVMLSSEGTAVDKFKTTLVPRKKYTKGAWVEEVVFLENIKGVVNIGWHVISATGIRTRVNLDNIIIKKVIGCPEPYYVKSVGGTGGNLNVEWQQDGGITSWEVEVVEYGNQPTGANLIKVNGNPNATLTGLMEGKAYSIYVRAICSDGGTTSDWSTALNTSIKVGKNDNCAGAINIPVNTGLDCEKIVSGSFLGANVSAIIEPFCHPGAVKTDVWFEFTATATQHMLKMSDIYSNKVSSSGSAAATFYIAVYDQDCSAIGNTAVSCFAFNNLGRDGIMMDLIPGKKYFVRVATTVQNPDFIFSLCITTSKYSNLEVSPSGDKYTVEELVKDVLVKSNCDLVSNIKYQAGENSNINTLGYFNKSNADFPFEEGIVLATHDVKFTPGPHRYVPSKDKVPAWIGDADLNEVIKQVGGAGFGAEKYVSVLEFDFIPIKDSINFEYLFASESYDRGCNYVCREGGALFAAWLTEIATGEGQNLALVPGTTEPIALSTIRDSQKTGAACKSVNPEFYSKYYDNVQDSKLDAPINYVGTTVAMSSEKVRVKAGKKYRIKLAIADFCPNTLHTSAVFFNAASFDLGTIDLGADLLVESNTALCSGETQIIKSGLSGEGGIAIEWFKDGVLMPGETNPDLEVSTSGTYKITAKYLDVNCETSGSVEVEIFPAISTVVSAPVTLPICRTSLSDLKIDLTEVEGAMLAKVDPKNYGFSYYNTKANAEAEEQAIESPQEYLVRITGADVKIYILVKDLHTGCSEIFEWTLRATAGTIPTARENVSVCAAYTFPALEANQHYYTGPAATGVEYKAGAVLDKAGLHIIYVLQDNGAGCYEQISYQVTITAAVVVNVFKDRELECEFYVLEPLSEYNKYFTQTGGQGVELAAGSLITSEQTIYVFAASEDRLCTDESSFKISFRECPIPKGISPNGDGRNDSFNLSQHGATSVVIYNRYGTEVYSFQGAYTNEWVGQDKKGNSLPDGTYFYVVVAQGKTRTGWVQINK